MSAVAEKEKVARPMTVQTIRTKAEESLIQQFAAAEATLPGGNATREARRSAIGRFAGQGLPHRRIEEWKYTDLRNLMREVSGAPVPQPVAASAAEINAALGDLAGIEATRLVFVDGRFSRSLSAKAPPKGVSCRPMAEVLAEDPAAAGLVQPVDGVDAVDALNVALMTDGARLTIEDDAVIAAPLLIVFARQAASPATVVTRNVITIGRNARVTVVEAHMVLSGASQKGEASAATSISVGDGAEVTHVKLSGERDGGFHLSRLEAALGTGCHYRPFQITAGAGVTRNDIAIVYNGERTRLDLSGVFLGRGGAHIDTTLVVDHKVPHCESRELFKGVLDDHARGIFQGKIIVRPGAQKTDGKQMAQALMLSSEAEFDSKPELEIYADDVACGHGSTAAEIDEDLLFYCRARGIPLPEARAMLTESFIGEAIDRIDHEAVREAMRGRVNAWLRAKAS